MFYLTGFIVVLLIYVWLDKFWLAAYNVPDYAAEAGKIPRLIVFHPVSLVAGLVLIAGAITYKKFFAADSAGFPSYFCFLVAAALVPVETARPFINWRAFSLTLFLIVLISLLWEATLAVPYGWWGYQPKQMMGLFIGTAHRGRLRMDGGQLLDDNHFRNHQAVAGFRQDRQSSISRLGMTLSSGCQGMP